ncbi:ANTAR domain-containing protein [Amycolatopsis magusensis]|uniref:ANTAR domain-containing protein n=1 Tax=Amycolatopsis magusensis TaxID=882444 RepID=UPI0037A132B7
MNGEPLTSEFAVLTRSLLTASSVGEVLDHVAAAAERLIRGVDVVSVSVRDRANQLHTPVGNSPLSAELDRLQNQFQEGPCFDAALPEGPATGSSDHLAKEEKWPKFGPAAADLGFTSVLSTALLPDPGDLVSTRGALNLFSHGQLSEEADGIALLLATHAALAIAHTQAVTRQELQRTQMRQAIESRDVIGQAKGILMARRGMNADEAFAVLRRTSQDLNVKLADLARTLATRHGELDLPDQL